MQPMGHVLSTDSVAPQQRLEFWVDMICSTYVELECDSAVSQDFAGSIVQHRLPGLDLSVVRSRAQQVMRTPRIVSNSNDDCFIVSLQKQGAAVISQDGREAKMTPGDFAIYDSTRPYTLQFADDFEEIVLKMPGEQVRSLLRHTDRLTATTVSGRSAAGHLLINMVSTLRDEAESLAPASAAAVAHGVISVLVAGLQSLPACGKTEPSTMNSYHVARIKQAIERRLRDPSASIRWPRNSACRWGTCIACSRASRSPRRSTCGTAALKRAAASWWTRGAPVLRWPRSRSRGASTTRRTSAAHSANASNARHANGGAARRLPKPRRCRPGAERARVAVGRRAGRADQQGFG
jgi:hypothetical protein